MTSITLSRRPRSSNPWSTIRFRRARGSRAWALIGIPTQIYPLVACRLFELNVKLLEKYEKDAFVSVSFEASSPVAARLALAFPAPPGCEALWVSRSGDRILTGEAVDAPNAIRQAADIESPPDADANPDLA